MNKIVLSVLFFVLFGGTINLGVAIICPNLARLTLLESRIVDEAGLAVWERLAKEDWPTHPGIASIGSRFGYETADWRAGKKDNPKRPVVFEIWVEKSGWPMLSLTRFGRSSNAGQEHLSGMLGLPLQPIWIGFLINTLIYGGVVALWFFGAKAYKKRRRKDKGLCPACAYNLRSDCKKGCPECGWGREAEV